MGCGICGFVGLSDRNLLRSMCEVIKHRGPDDSGYFIDNGVGLGADRLRIIDLVTGAQPIHNEDNSVWVVFNGEIYAYQELKAELEAKGHAFYTESDSETLVHAYEEWKEECVNHLRGMFAFAIWDTGRRRLFLARDRYGKKPLYYAELNDFFLFGSEIKSILQYEELRREIDKVAVDYYFTYMYIPSPLSIFKSVRKLPPGHYGVLERGKFSIHQYWDMRFQPDDSLTEDGLVDLLYDSIREAVKVRLRSDVPLGAFLSGGIDSSTVVSFMSRLSTIPVKTVSIGFNTETSEVKYSRTVSDFLKTDHREFIVTPDAFRVLPKLLWHFDEPFADPSMIPTYYLSEVTRREVTVALSGDGGDELFMGYPFLIDPASYALYSKIPSPLRKAALKVLIHAPGDKQFKREAKHAYEKDYGRQSFAERYAMRVSLHDSSGLRRTYSETHLNEHTPVDTYRYLLEFVGRSGSGDPLNALDYATIRSYLEEDILTKVDRMSMAVSLEVRCPLLDQRFAELIAKIPSRYKMNGRATKYIFKKMAVKKGLIPSDIANRKKQGFGAPIEVWLRNEWKDVTSQVLDPLVTRNYTGLFDREHVKSLMQEPYLNSSKLFTLINFVLWYKMYVDEGIRRSPSETVSVFA